jgi:hypothetical protein
MINGRFQLISLSTYSSGDRPVTLCQVQKANSGSSDIALSLNERVQTKTTLIFNLITILYMEGLIVGIVSVFKYLRW